MTGPDDARCFWFLYAISPMLPMLLWIAGAIVTPGVRVNHAYVSENGKSGLAMACRMWLCFQGFTHMVIDRFKDLLRSNEE